MALKRSNFIGPVQPWLDDTAFASGTFDRTHIEIEQIGWWDEMHVDCIIGFIPKANNNKAVRFYRNADGKIDKNGTLKKKQTKYQPKYGKQGRYCLGCAVVKNESGEREGVVAPLYDYSGKKLITLADWKELVEKEIRRVKGLRSPGEWIVRRRRKGEYWRSDDVGEVKGVGSTSKTVLFENAILSVGDLIDLDEAAMAVVCSSASGQVARKIRSAQIEAQNTVKEGDTPPDDIDYRRAENPYLARYGAEEWEAKISKAAALSGYALVTDMIRHIHDETKKMMAGTKHEDDWFFYHDALSLMTCAGTVEWMKEQEDNLYERWLTPMHFGKEFGRFANRPPGNSPEMMPWDNSLNKDLKDAVLFHVCLTYSLHEDDNKKFSLSTPGRTTKAFKRILEGGLLSSSRIVHDVLGVLSSLKKISAEAGGYVPGLANRNGWRRRSEGGHGGKRVCLSDAERLATAEKARIHPSLAKWLKKKSPYQVFKEGLNAGERESDELDRERSEEDLEEREQN